MENHNFEWVNPLLIAIFNSYICMFTRGYTVIFHHITPYLPISSCSLYIPKLVPEVLRVTLWVKHPLLLAEGDRADLDGAKVQGCCLNGFEAQLWKKHVIYAYRLYMAIYGLYGGFHSHRGTPIAGWFVIENPNIKWMIWGRDWGALCLQSWNSNTPCLEYPPEQKGGELGSCLAVWNRPP